MFVILLTDSGLIREIRVFSVIKGDNLMIGVSFVDSNTINFGKRVLLELLS